MTAAATERFLDRLAKSGLNRAYVSRLLPEWASSLALDDESVLVELKLALARRFGLDVQALLSEAEEVRWRTLSPRYKRSKRVRESDLDVTTAICVSAARIAIAGVSAAFVRPPSSGLELRAAIQKTLAPKFISLGAILRFTWDSGIPVLFVSDLPEGVPKMDALSVSHMGRPAIVVSKSVRYSAWLSFIISHELAHIGLGHLGNDDLIVDDKISDESYLLQDDDVEERDADEYAIALLNGEHHRKYKTARTMNPQELATAAMTIQREQGVDAGHVILNLAHGSGAWNVAMAALNLLDHGDARLLLQSALRQEIVPNLLPDDNLEYLLKIAGGAQEA